MSAAGVLAVACNSGRVLVTRRSMLVSSPLTWSFPCGGVERIRGALETPAETAVREFYEETLVLLPKGDLRPVGRYADGSVSLDIFVCYFANEFAPHLNEENDAFLWLTPQELLSLKSKHYGFEAMLQSHVLINALMAC